MSKSAALPAYICAIAAGLMLWWIATAATGGREPWDSDLYWRFAYPAAILLSALLGYVFPDRPWRWALAIMLSQAVMMLCHGSGLGLLPLGLAFLAILSLPGAVAAELTARLRR